MYIIRDIQGNPIITIKEDDLYFANLCYKDLRNADFRGQKMVYACLSGANIIGADFRGADLRGASMGDTTFDGAIVDDTTLLPQKEEPEYHRPCWM